MKRPSVKSIVAFFELGFATVIWGFGFTATIWSLEYIDPISISVIRFGGAFLVGLLLWRLIPSFQKISMPEELKLAMIPGVLLGLVLVLQTWGLEFTSATNSGFITTLYTVIIPLIEVFIFKKKLSKFHIVFVAMALAGTVLLLNLHSLTLNIGDLLTLGCSFAAAIHIIWVGQVSNKVKSAFIFNTAQSFWAFLLSVCFIPFYGNLRLAWPEGKAQIGMASLVFGSTLIAFALQVKAQKYLSASVSSLIFLMESPFASFFAVVLLGDVLTGQQLWGCFLILLSALGATLL